nr:hypothetical protein [Tanacetum cinerariifolium]
MEDQPLAADASPTALSPGYVVDSDPKKDEKDKEEEEHPAPADPSDVSTDDLEPMKDQPLPADASPTAISPGYVVNSNPEEDEKDLNEDRAYYPADRGDNDDDESSNDDEDDDDVEKDEEDKEDEEHLASADPFDVSTDYLVPSS